MRPAYDLGKSYQENYDRGPDFEGGAAEIPVTPLKSFLGLAVRSRMGIAAGLLLNSKWVAGYAQRGFDILVYKTVRSRFRASHPWPNWVLLEEPEAGEGPVFQREDWPGDLNGLSSAVCFGMPSMAPEIWREDVQRSKGALKQGQVLFVSVVASPGERASVEEVAEDFALCAGWAVESGADGIEANFSCPNVCSAEGTIYRDAAFSGRISRRIRERIGQVPLLIKAGCFESADNLREFLRAVNGWCDGITMVNGISRPVLTRQGTPVFGERFVRAGVLGRAIHKPSIQSVSQAVDAVRKESLKLEIVAVGGVSTVGDIDDFFRAGAAGVLMGSSPMYQPELAVAAKRAHPEW